MKDRKRVFIVLLLVFIVIIGLFTCSPEEFPHCPHRILAVVAHPDDETLISGTLAKLADRGCDVTVIYITSGDDGPDMTGMGLHGAALALEREDEARKSLDQIGITNPPVFLKFPDSYVWENSELIRDSLLIIISRINPHVVITFGPDGVTDDPDHITTGFVTDQVFDSIPTGKLLLHMAVSVKASRKYPIPAPVVDSLIDLRVDVSGYKRARLKSNKAHRTQFRPGQRLFWKMFVCRYPYEEFVIAGSRKGEGILQQCF